MELIAPRPGDRIDRYEIRVAAGAGGMGSVYRASTEGGPDVALKLMAVPGAKKQLQFEREVAALARLRSPFVVRYVDHGPVGEGWRWLAMEWLDGEDLSSRLGRRSATFREAYELAVATSEALAVVHDAGLVHRDVKPSNLFCGLDGSLKLIDFGICESRGAAQRLGPSPGTPGYMAPEQARGGGTVDARSDLFSLGCVLYEQITGRAAFISQHRRATLARVVLDQVPPASELHPEVPAALETLIEELLAKNPGDRPASAREVRGRLEGMSLTPRKQQTTQPARESLGDDEQQLVCVVMAVPPEGHDTTVDTVTDTDLPWEPQKIADLAERAESELEYLSDGTALVYASGAIATDVARRAAACALALSSQSPGVSVVLSTGQALLGGRWPVGEAVDSAAQRLSQATARVGPEVLLDDLSAELLRDTGDIAQRKAGEAVLVGLSRSVGPNLGESSFVARDEELAQARRWLKVGVGDHGAPKALIVVGDAGIGKSRFATELRRELHEDWPLLEVWRVGASPLDTSAPLTVARRLLESVLGPHPTHETLARHVAPSLSPRDRYREVAFLSHLSGQKSDHPAVVAARRNPAELESALSAAFGGFLAAGAHPGPRLLIVDDAQWCDPDSAALLRQNVRGCFTLWLARSASDSRLPEGCRTILLEPLGAEASRELLANRLGPGSAAELAERLLEQAGGHPLLLEELGRWHQEGTSRADAGVRQVTSTPLAILGARLQELDPERRRTLRAASIFGKEFTVSGLLPLLGQAGPGRLPRQLRDLADAQLLDAPRLPNGVFRFRHDLWREAAYASLTEEDRLRGHRLVGGWFAQRADVEPGVVASHFREARAPDQAAPWFLAAADRALSVGSMSVAKEHLVAADHGTLSARERARLNCAEAEIALWSGNLERSAGTSAAALEALAPESSHWPRAAACRIQAAGRLGLMDEILALEPACKKSSEATWLVCQLARELVRGGRLEQADVLTAWVESHSHPDPALRAELESVRAARTLLDGDLAAQRRHWSKALAAYEELGQRPLICATRGELGFTSYLLGDHGDARVRIERALAEARQSNYTHVEAWLLCILGPILSELGELERAIEVERAAIALLSKLSEPRLHGAALAYLSLMESQLPGGDHGIASAEAACVQLDNQPVLLVLGLTALARAQLAAGQLNHARESVARALSQFGLAGGVEEGEALLHLTHCEVLERQGETDRATEVAGEAAADLERRAMCIQDPGARQGFLDATREHRELLRRRAP